MDSKQIVMALYGAYATGDADQIAGLLHDEVVWTAPTRGANDLDREAIVAFMAHNFARFFGGARNAFRTVTAEGSFVVVEHRLSATLPNGRPYVNDYCFVYEVRDGKVRRIREYMDTRGGWAQVFGEGEPIQLIEFTGNSVRTPDQ
jgi:uncharacterized protein